MFRPEDTKRILAKARAALVRGGTLVLETHTARAVERRGQTAPTWTFLASGLFSPRPHLLLTRHAWWPEARVATTRFLAIDASTSEVEVHTETVRARDPDEWRAILGGSGFDDVRLLPSLTGAEDPSQPDFRVVLAR